MSEVASLCTAILRQLDRLEWSTSKNMLPGLSKQRIQELTAGLPFKLPASLIELYEWSEGVSPESGEGNEFIPGYGIDTLSEMVETYRELSADDEYPRFHASGQFWFPFLRSGGTDYYAVDCADIEAEDAAVVFDDNEGPHRSPPARPETAFVSLEAMLRTVLRAYERGAYFVEDGRLEVGLATFDKNGRLVDVDMSQFDEIARAENPGVSRYL